MLLYVKKSYKNLVSKLIDAAQIMNSNDFNGYYLKACFLIGGESFVG